MMRADSPWLRRGLTAWWLACSLFLAYPMVMHGWMKVNPNATEEPEKGPDHELDAQGLAAYEDHVTRKTAYLDGIKGTGYLWELIGVLEILGALLLLIPRTNAAGALLLWPITLNVWLFHLVLEPELRGELIFTTGMMVANTALLLRHRSAWVGLLSRPA